MTGYIFQFFGGTMSWKAVLQDVVALSTTEGEYMDATEGMKEALWLKGFIEQLGIMLLNAVIHYDNQNAIFLMKNLAFQRDRSI